MQKNHMSKSLDAGWASAVVAIDVWKDFWGKENNVEVRQTEIKGMCEVNPKL